jgi:CubicO group peptidase (beta-lactamase class C family)
MHGYLKICHEMKKMKFIQADVLIRIGFTMIFIFVASAGFTQQKFTELDKWMEENTKTMGGRAILVIYQEGDMIYKKSVFDMTTRQKSLNKWVAKKQGRITDPEEYTLKSRQLIASCSKWLSATLIMTFIDEGRLRLSDTVGAYLPVLSLHGKGGITIGECLSHLTGIKAPPLKKSLGKMKHISSMEQAIGEIAELPMEGTPGKVFHYSNTGLQIAGAVIEKISGRSFGDLFADRIAKPLGLKNTDFGKGPVALPAGGASSTPEDYLTFLSMILHKGKFKGKQILSENSISEMETDRLGSDVKIAYSPAEARGLGYGFGEWVVKGDEGGKPSKWVTSPGLFGSFPWVENEKKYCAFLMTFYLNNKERNDRYLGLKQLVDEALR